MRSGRLTTLNSQIQLCIPIIFLITKALLFLTVIRHPSVSPMCRSRVPLAPHRAADGDAGGKAQRAASQP